MKRQPKQADLCRKHFPLLFWTYCQSCESECVREWMWVTETGPYFLGPIGGAPRGRRMYLCRTCAPTIEKANDYWAVRALPQQIINSSSTMEDT